MTALPRPRLSLGQILYPRTVAVFGASEDRSKFGGRIFHYLLHHRFGGALIPINRSRDVVHGLKCYPHIAAAPGPIDVAILAIPANSMAQTIRECGEAGVGACVIITSGFAEQSEEGGKLQDEIVSIARSYGLRLIGPNCMGIVNPAHNLCLTSSQVFDVPQFHKGSIGLISQSGAVMLTTFNRAYDRGIGFSICASLGNQSDITFEDIFEYMIEDKATKAICMYIEGLREGRRFSELAKAARAAGKPVLVVKTGRTRDGAKAARSHTASLAGTYGPFEAACRDAGVLLTDDPDGMIATASLMVRWGGLSREGIGVISPSGGGTGIGADRVSEAGLQLAALSADTKSAVIDIMANKAADNPLDLFGGIPADTLTAINQSVEIFARDDNVGALFILMPTLPIYDQNMRAIATAALESGKPIILVFVAGTAADAARAVLRELDVPYFEGVDDGIRVLKLYVQHYRDSLRDVPPEATRPDGLPDTVAIEDGELTEPEAKKLLADYGLRIPQEKVVRSAAEAIAAATAMGFPVVLKAVARGLMHKSDVGGVALDLRDASAVAEAFARVEAAVANLPDATFEGAVVAEMISGGTELIIGANHDPQFGGTVLVGSGGIAAELMRDVSLGLAPVSKEKAYEMLRSLNIWPLLDGYRGRARLDVEAAADAIVRVSWLAADLGPRLRELDVNPLILRPIGDGAIVVDAAGTIVPAVSQDLRRAL